jgi:hypothetical protein
MHASGCQLTARKREYVKAIYQSIQQNMHYKQLQKMKVAFIHDQMRHAEALIKDNAIVGFFITHNFFVYQARSDAAARTRSNAFLCAQRLDLDERLCRPLT